MTNKTVLISGASIAGPALAYWLNHYGYQVTVVEKAPTLRQGGQAVDFKGETHMTVLRRMGILDDIKRLATGGHDQTLVDADGKALGVVPGEFTGGELEIHRGRLATLMYERTRNDCEYVFGDSISTLTETADGVHVTFAKAEPRTFDLVVGADGIHSNVRRLAFGPEQDFVTHLGYYYALADIGWPGEAQMYNEPGLMLAVGGSKALTFLVFASEQLSYDRYDTDQQKKIVLDAYQNAGWRTSEVMAQVPAAEDFYLDSVSRVHMDHYAKGRVVLLGDAAYGNTLGGFGSGLAIVGAYVLAGELHAANGDHRVAFAAYEDAFRGYAAVARKGTAGPFLAPATKAGIRLRNWLFNNAFLFRTMLRMTNKFATSIELKSYE